MKSQDIVLLLKLVALSKLELDPEAGSNASRTWPLDWQDWEDAHPQQTEIDDFFPAKQDPFSEYIASRYTARHLEQETGISKSQVNLALNRCMDVGLAKKDRRTGVPRANTRALYDFIVYGLKYIFPGRPGEVTRGIATAFAAPVLNEKLMSAGEWVPVWPDARGNTKGQAVEPLCKSVPYAVRKDPEMYALLALVDAIRIGQPREANLACELLKKHMGVR
ncbi:hypothetical protein [Zhongshania sp. BJYM1]|uniref:hypothetical protein n=1 Tax=Zhongshania aquatica TaxID=2965069 RepID=UPI0022B461B0|nr:hypothetical protein [Marortus sp. BJYM1]